MGKENEKSEKDYEFTDAGFSNPINDLLNKGCTLSDLYKAYCDANVEQHKVVNDLVGSYLKSKEVKLTPSEARDFYKGLAKDALVKCVELLSTVHASLDYSGNILGSIDALLMKYMLYTKQAIKNDDEKHVSIADFIAMQRVGKEKEDDDTND